MLITGINDPRVPPWELGKFAARLQAATPAAAGPSSYASTTTPGTAFSPRRERRANELLADQYSFLLWQLGDPEFNLPIRIGVRR